MISKKHWEFSFYKFINSERYKMPFIDSCSLRAFKSFSKLFTAFLTMFSDSGGLTRLI